MKRVMYLTLLSILIACLNSKAQTVGSVPVEELEAEYIELLGTAKFLKLYEVTLTVDYGQIGSLKDVKESPVLDKDGKVMTFNGMMHAVNFFANYGYKLQFAYPVTIGNSLVYHYIMQKPK